MNVANALAALGGETIEPEVSADLPNAQVPPDVQALAFEAAQAHDAFRLASAVAKAAKERAADLADDLKAAMTDYKLQAVPLADRDPIVLEAYAAKAGSPQSTMKAIKATLAEMNAENARQLHGDDVTDAQLEIARKSGVVYGAALWKALPRPMKPAGVALRIPELPEIDEPDA